VKPSLNLINLKNSSQLEKPEKSEYARGKKRPECHVLSANKEKTARDGMTQKNRRLEI
jgi:hypothetical protein